MPKRSEAPAKRKPLRLRRVAATARWAYVYESACTELARLEARPEQDLPDRTLILIESLLPRIGTVIAQLDAGRPPMPCGTGSMIDDLWDVHSSEWFRSERADRLRRVRACLGCMFLLLCRRYGDYGPPSLFGATRSLVILARREQDPRVVEHIVAVLRDASPPGAL